MWNVRESPLRIEKRFEFEEYAKISKFIGKIEKLCKEKNTYPNISFGKNFVSLSIFLDGEEISSEEKDFSKDIDKFYLED
ncbi:4a-hydroxytetrahydrobiopterin dehydratase [uncultured Prochlorococcus sp.]|uniref:4a-hydroxytetrahydrobiopterin dehydratase n=1 Tax=uncultured Prochlorococcus sp. TaxID=159733 RepID=UPI0025860E2A|nr:4a-hydroxytetrahydrobiopterin dehydratase [uncultured Prochlorococcus sp.]